MQPHDLLTLPEVAKLFEVTESTVLTYLRSGKIKCNKVGYKWLIPYQAILDYLTGKHDNNNAMQATEISEVTKCPSLKEMARGKLISLHRADNEYANLLKPKTSAKRKNSTTR